MTKKSWFRARRFRLIRFSKEDAKIAIYPIAGIDFAKDLIIFDCYIKKGKRSGLRFRSDHIGA